VAIQPPSAITVAINPLPQPPQTSDPANFDVRADAFVLAEQVFSQQVELARQQVSANALVSQNNAQEAANSAAASAAQVGLAAAQVGLAADQVALAAGKVTLATQQADRATEKAGAAADTLALIQNIASGLSFTSTSTTLNSISAGSKTFTVDAGESFKEGMPIYAVVNNDPTRYMVGVCTAYSGTTLTVAVSQVSANTGTFSAWNISIGGIPGTAGQGVPNGGATGQMLRKKSAADYDAEWSTLLIGDIGDVVYSYATDKGPNWKKADGSIVSRASYPDFAVKNGSPINKASANVSFQTVYTASSEGFTSCVKIGSLWIASTSLGRIFTSPDLTNWTERANLGANYSSSLIASDGIYVTLVSYSGYVARSSDGGLTWSALGAKITTYSNGVRKICAGPGRFLVAAWHEMFNSEEGNYNEYIYILNTTDGGQNWNTSIVAVGAAGVGGSGSVLDFTLTWTGSKYVFIGGVVGVSSYVYVSAAGGNAGWNFKYAPYLGGYDLIGSGAIGSRIYVVLSNMGTQISYYSDDDGSSWNSLGSIYYATGGSFVSLSGSVVYIANSGSVQLIDPIAKTATSLGSQFGLRPNSQAQISDTDGIIVFPGGASGTAQRVGLFKPFNYDPATQTALPTISNLAGGKSVPAWVKVL